MKLPGWSCKSCIVLMLCLVASAAPAADSDPYAPYRAAMKGDARIFQITVQCDSLRLQHIRTRLKPGKQAIFWYRYAMYINFKHGKVVNATLEPASGAADLPEDGNVPADADMPMVVRQCILSSFLSEAHFQAPANGTVPFEVSFPVIMQGAEH